MMKLYSDSSQNAPSPRRVRIFVAEKGQTLNVIQLALHKENRTESFRKKNPIGALPVLELDDGTCISESMAICRYLEEIWPEPNLFGTTPLEKATIEMWNRRAEFGFYLPIEYAGGFLGDEVARNARKRVKRMIKLFDSELANRPFIASKDISVADITMKAAIDFGVQFNGIQMPDDASHFLRWNNEMGSRPSMIA